MRSVRQYGGQPEIPLPPLSHARQVSIAFVVACAFLMQGVDSTLLTIAVPVIAADLGASPLALHLLITSYLLSLAVFMPVSGWFADRFGARRVYSGAVILFMTASALCAAMPDLWSMVALRLVQGFGGALMTPLGRMIVLRAFGPGRTLEAMTWLTLPTLLGPLMGPVIGAVLIESFDWRILFFVNLPVCLVALIGGWRLFPEQPKGQVTRFDLTGFAIAGLSLVLFQIAIEVMGRAASPLLPTVLAMAAAVAVFLIYVRHARRVRHPALEVGLFRKPSFMIGVVAGGIGRAGLNASAFLVPLMLQLGMGFRPLTAGILAAMAGLGAFASKPILSRLLQRFGFRPVLVWLTLAGSGSLALFALAGPGWPVWALIGLALLAGATRTLHFNAVNTLTYAGLRDHELSGAVSSAGVFQQLTMGLGISLSAAILSQLQGDKPLVSLEDFQLTFFIMALIPLVSLPFVANLRPTAETPAPRPANG